MSRCECSRRVEHLDAFGCERLQLAGAALDAVELLPDVEPGERQIAGLENRKRTLRFEQRSITSARAGGCDERFVGRAPPVGDDGKLHGEKFAECKPCQGKNWERSCVEPTTAANYAE